MACAALRELGYRVIAAPTADHALEQAEREPGLDAVITDVVLPRISGHDLVERLSRGRPTLKVLLISGYAGKAALRDLLGQPHHGFLAKPFVPVQLARALRTLLDHRESDLDG